LEAGTGAPLDEKSLEDGGLAIGARSAHDGDVTGRAAIVLVAALVGACAGAPVSSSGSSREAPDDTGEVGPPEERAPPSAQEAVASALDDAQCGVCGDERRDCERLGWDDCGARWSGCRERCLALARTSDATPGSACSDDARCEPGLCCRNGSCERNALVYFPLEPQISHPVSDDDPSLVRGSVLSCAIVPLEENRAGGSPLVRSLRRQRESFRRCDDRAADEPALRASCVCDVACTLRLDLDGGDPSGVTTVRYPFFDVDGLEITVDPEGRVTRCRYSRLGAPEESVDRSCG
jgi:hypothetical protein